MTKARRAHGEGSIYKRESDGRWVAQIPYVDQSGRTRRKWIYGSTEREVLRKKKAVERGIAEGRPVPSERQTVESYLAWYVANVLPKSGIKPSTAEQYEWTLNHYVVPALGGVKLANLGPSHIERMQADMITRGLSASTVRSARAVLSRALGYAEQTERVSRNMVKLVPAPPKRASRTDDALTTDEAKSLLKAIEGYRLEALVVVALGMGLRRGEALGLKWENIDFDGRLLSVEGTLKRRKGGGYFVDSPKTPGSRRRVPLPNLCAQALERRRNDQTAERLVAGALWNEQGFVFTTPTGTPLDGDNVYKQFQVMCLEAGIPKRRFHALRHSTAMVLYEQRVPLEQISEILGHSSLAITKDIYLNLRPEMLRPGADAMDRALLNDGAGA